MTAPSDGSQIPPNSDLSVIRPPSSAPAEPTAADRPRPDATSKAASFPEPSNLAGDTLLQRSERQSRDMLITAGFRLKQRVSHPDGGDCPVEEILLQEKAQRTEIDGETTRGSRKHRRLPRWMRSIPKYVLGFDLVSCCTSSRG